MSLKTDKDNIYVFSPFSRYNNYDTSEWSNFMEKDFTIVVELSINSNEMSPQDLGYFVCRNGKHAGLSCYKDSLNNITIIFSYFFWKHESIEISGENVFLEPISIEKNIKYLMDPEEKEKSHTFVVRCDDTSKKIYCYMDNKLLGEIDYLGLEKHSYKNDYMYLGCATMLSEDDKYKCIGNFEYYFLMCLDKCISLDEINNLKNNYKDKYYEDYFGFPKLNSSTPYKGNIQIFLDFEHNSTYKLWNSAFNGCVPNFYIKDNTIY